MIRPSGVPIAGVDVERHETWLPNLYQITRLRASSSGIYAAWVVDGDYRYLALVIDRRIGEDPLTPDEVEGCVLAAFWERNCGDGDPVASVVAVDDITMVAGSRRIKDVPNG